jgi:tetratricopeptide (TPR) repeat protein
MVRMAAMQVLGRMQGNESLQTAVELMNDPVRAVRYEAALSYTRVPYPDKAEVLRSDQKKHLEEYMKMLMVNADQSATHVNLGIYYQGENMIDSAMNSYRDALRVDSNSIEAAINIADLYRVQNQDEKGKQILTEFMTKHPDRAEISNALGLLYVRQKQSDKALELFARSLELEPENTYYIYIYGVALNSVGKREEAIKVLKKGYAINPFDINITYTLAAIYRESGDNENFQKFYDQVLWLQQGAY